MKIWTLIFICCSLTLNTFRNIAYAEDEFYVSTDKHGNKTFSDKPPANNQYQIEQYSSIQTINMVETPKYIINRLSNKTTNKTTTKNKKFEDDTSLNLQCLENKQLIDKLDKQLKKPLKARIFDEIKDKLSDLRWQYRKSC